MIDVKFDLRDFERMARQLGAAADQVPFALAGALNDALFKTRTKLISETWPQHVTVRNAGFMRGALRIEKATKGNLRGEINSSGVGDRGHLRLHATGGIKRAQGALAIPDPAKVRRGAKGVSKNQRPRALPNSFRKGEVIYQRLVAKKRKTGGLRLMYVLKPQATIKKDVPFYEDFRRSMIAEVHAAFPGAMAKAMRTRR
ncbi:hypothetical protein [Chelatococcus reniformis]|uniref:Uncharacterized protein n=1 Tax=Chelatococcus reniformis TaxID=1494448 RepID=A0A916UG80_9HYPH|nr:hypothetical protein [Chelatococcus reniformis]GGC70663.1 hypothetical protein GCM10010994_31520 [Chelatococcus reniformis]